MKALRLAAVMAAAAVVACHSTPPPQAAWDHNVSFSGWKTFGWYADPQEDKGIGSAIVDTRFVDDHVKKDVTALLVKKGFHPAAADATPDFLLDYHTRANGIVSRDQYGVYTWWSLPTYIGSETYRERTLAIDIRDPAKKLVWRGWVSKFVGNSPEAIAKDIRRAVDQILGPFPPPPGAATSSASPSS
jgi:hypothetical protein